MATLTGQQIDASYLGLLKTTDNGVIGVTAKALTDGGGNATNIEITNTATNFVSGTVDFTGSTVSGIPGALRAGSLAPGNFSNNIRNISTPGGLQVSSNAIGWESMAFGSRCNSVDSYSTAMGWESTAGAGSNSPGGQVAIGYNAKALGLASVAIGGYGQVDPCLNNGLRCVSIGAAVDTNTADNAIAIGSDIGVTGTGLGIAIGNELTVTSNSGYSAIAIGHDNTASNILSQAYGNECTSTGVNSLAMGFQSNATGRSSICLGQNNSTANEDAIAIGTQTNTNAGLRSIAMGRDSLAAANYAVAIGAWSDATAEGAYALGRGTGTGNKFTAARVDTVSVKKLAIEDISGGIIMKSPNGTEYTLTVSDAGALVIT